ncbi:MAG: M23 family metallopeptidase [Spirochaetaceae bacterium]|nr:M23 family metallopeptidase [Spirochaetaceae bacterium]MCF7948646.1 M23 family metallopeptidase [Spirochaetia bacterium]MCF7950706.1 M23 family metallopeptidase [Spirochaetaceae bacterium]
MSGLATLGADNTVVVVKKGETLYSIGREYNVSVQALIQANGIVNPRALKAGTRIKVPNTYIIEKGDTLYGIARRNDFSVDELVNLNDIDKDSLIKIGQVIQLPSSDSYTTADASEQKDSNSDARFSKETDSEESDSDNGNGTDAAPTYSDVVQGKEVLWPHAGNRSKLDGKLQGTQISGNRGDQVVSVSSGKVVWVAPYRGYGTLVMVESANGLIYAYGGNESTYVEVGERVDSGTVIGRLGINPIEKTAKLFFFVYKNGKPVDPATAPRG